VSFIYFLILIGVLIFVHEFGHFVVARLFDVKVHRFSIGFGPVLVKWQGKETEYTISILPLGGYVQMAGADLEEVESLSEEDQKRSLMAKPIWQRSLVVLAGPAANMILPVMIYFVFGMMQTTTVPAVIGQVFPETPAAEAGLQPGDRLVSINGKKIDFWHETLWLIHPAVDEELSIVYERDGEVHTTVASPETITSTDFLGLRRRTIARIGIAAGPSATVVALADRSGPASRAGIRSFDKIVSVDGEHIERFDELKALVRASGGAPMTLGVLRPESIDVDFAGLHLRTPYTVEVVPELVDGVYSLGLDPADLYIAFVHPGGAAEQAGLLPGDRVVAIDGRAQGSWALVHERIENTVNAMIVARDASGEDEEPLVAEFELTVKRGDEALTLVYHPEIVAYQDETTQTMYRIAHGWENFRNSVAPEEVHHPFVSRLTHSARMGVHETWEFTQMMMVGLVRLAQGRITLRSVGGPIMIGELAAEAGRAGYEPFLRMMALISINLAIINLLPIPILDGGRLVFFALEALKRGPLSLRTRQIASYVGLVLILLLMLLAFKNDIERNWYRVVEYFEER
jgi:regulator of sigma E protease